MGDPGRPAPVTIREARPEDAGALSALARRAKASWGYPDAWMTAWQRELTITPAYVAAHPTFVARLGDVVCGMCAVEDRGDGWSLEHLWIDPTAQRRGIGRALLERALAATAARPGDVEVLSDPHAVEFYRAIGAREAGAVPAPMPGAPERVLPRFILAAGAGGAKTPGTRR